MVLLEQRKGHQQVVVAFFSLFEKKKKKTTPWPFFYDCKKRQWHDYSLSSSFVVMFQ